MPDNFVPLAAIAKSTPGQGFTPLEFKSAQPAPAQASATGSAPAPAPAAPKSPGPTRALQDCTQPKVTLQRDGDKVTAIYVECGCGQVIDLNCVY